MSILKLTIQFLQKPFPVEDNELVHIRNMVLIGLFVGFFLYIFQPFGISELESGKLLMCGGFGLMTILSSLFFAYIVSPILRLHHYQKHFTFGKWILNMTGVLLTISLFNFLFARSYFGTIRWEFFPAMMYSTITIGLFPIVLLGAVSMSRQERKYLNIAKGINESEKEAHKQIEKETPKIFGIDSSKIRYVEALQNYVKVGFIDDEGQLKEQTERSTLKQVLQMAEGTNLVKCHRSYFVNRDHIEEVQGNAQGLLLTLDQCDNEIPVSRSYVAKFR